MARDSEKWRHTFKADANNEKEEDPDTEEYNRTDENYFASYKLDRKLGEDAKNYLFNVLTTRKIIFRVITTKPVMPSVWVAAGLIRICRLWMQKSVRVIA